MEKKEPHGAAGGFKRSPGRATKKVPGGLKWAEEDAGQPSTSDLNVSEPSKSSKEAVARSPGASRPSGEVAALGSGPSKPPGQAAARSLEVPCEVAARSLETRGEVVVRNLEPPGEVAGRSLEVPCKVAGRSLETRGEVAVRSLEAPGEVASRSLGSDIQPAAFIPCPGTNLSRESSSCSGRPKGYISAYSPHSPNTHEDQSGSILNSCMLMQKLPNVGKKKSQRWDEMNILATYHPPGKDYGLMKVDEPSTPYHRLQDSLEDLHTGSSHTVTPETLTERFATMDNFYPKVLQYGDNRYTGSLDDFTKTHSSDFDQHRKAHYNEAKFLKSQKTLPLDNDRLCSGGGAIVSRGSQGVMPDPEPRPVERVSKRGSTRGVKDETGLVAKSHVLEAKDSQTGRNQPPAKAPTKTIDQLRKEYYSQGIYLRSCAQPELEEDIDEEQKDSTFTSLPLSTEVCRLDFAESSFQDHNSLTVAMTPSQPGTPLPSGSQVVSGWCQWLVTRELSWQSSEGSKSESENNPNPRHQSNHRYETLRLQWNQEKETRQWKM